MKEGNGLLDRLPRHIMLCEFMPDSSIVVGITFKRLLMQWRNADIRAFKAIREWIPRVRGGSHGDGEGHESVDNWPSSEALTSG
ncbi:MAG: hypothetical protein Q9217_002242 [Psora testacea]